MTLRLLAVCFALPLAGCGLLGGRNGGHAAAPGAPAAAAAAPAGEPELPPGPVSFVIGGVATMNAGGNAARVYLYPLSSDAVFRATPVQAFWDAPETVLAADLAGTVRDATVRPGTSGAVEGLTLGSAPFLGIAADLREPDGDRWRVLLPASQVRGRTVRVTVTEGGLEVVSE